MMKFQNWVNKMVARAAGASIRREEGQAMVEYGLILALISIAAIAVILTIGPKLITIFTDVANNL